MPEIKSPALLSELEEQGWEVKYNSYEEEIDYKVSGEEWTTTKVHLVDLIHEDGTSVRGWASDVDIKDGREFWLELEDVREDLVENVGATEFKLDII